MQHYLNLLNFEVYNKKGFYQTGRGLKIEVSNIMKARKAKQNNNKNENNDKNKRVEALILFNQSFQFCHFDNPPMFYLFLPEYS